MSKFDVTFTRTSTGETFRQVIDSTSKAKLLDDARKAGCSVERCVEVADALDNIIPKSRPIYRYLVTAKDSDGIEVEFVIQAVDEAEMKTLVNPALKIVRYRPLGPTINSQLGSLYSKAILPIAMGLVALLIVMTILSYTWMKAYEM